MAQGEAQEVWETDLKPNIIQILTGSEPLTYATYSEVYSTGLNFILKGKGKQKIDNNDNCKCTCCSTNRRLKFIYNF
jgi:hypothetical protein